MNYLYVFITEKKMRMFKPESYFMENSMEFLSQTVKTRKKVTQLSNQMLLCFLYFLRSSKGTVVDNLLKIALIS